VPFGELDDVRVGHIELPGPTGPEELPHDTLPFWTYAAPRRAAGGGVGRQAGQTPDVTSALSFD
jgi:hypothetical protein